MKEQNISYIDDVELFLNIAMMSHVRKQSLL